MKRLVVLLAFVFLPTAAVAHADGCPPSTCGTTSEAVPGAKLLFVRPSGPSGPLVAYDLARRVRSFALPAGTLTADTRTFFVTHSGKTVTSVVRYDARTGARRDSWSMAGRWWVGAATANGRTLAFAGSSTNGRISRFVLVDGSSGRVAKHFSLRGSYQVDAVAPGARRLFLIHWRRNTYDLLTYDVSTGRLAPTRLAEPDEKMHGTASGAVATRDGRWLLTLYVTGNGAVTDGAFVHALDLRSGIAHCIDLPLHGDFFSISATRLVLSPDERSLYLASPALGRLTVVDLRRLHVRRVVRFEATPAVNGNVGVNAAVSVNGRMLAFSGDRQVWLYDSAYARLRGAIELAPATAYAQSVAGLGFTPDGHRVVALRADGHYAVLDAATGQRVHVTPVQSERFAVRAGGLGPLVGYDTAALQPVFFLPEGRASADGSSYFAALPERGGVTRIERFAPNSGRLMLTFPILGRWSMGAVSASATTIALAQHEHGTTRVRVIDSVTGKTLHARALNGVYSVDAVTDDAQRLFLIRHYRSGRYAVQALDLVRGRIWTATLREKGQAEQPLMTGQAAGQVASKDGTWLLTLYLNTHEHMAFVHALNLRRAYAVCIDLPSGTHRIRFLRDYSLSLAPDGDVYAANGTLGVIAHIDLKKQSATDVLSFAPSRSGGFAASALSRNGRMLFFTSGRSLWSYDTAFDVLRGPVREGSPILGLAFSHDGRRVFAARADGGVAAFDAARAKPLSA